MTTTRNDNDRETICWFAEECLGLVPHEMADGLWVDEMGDDSVRAGDLLGWPGFGRVVEYVGIDKRMRLTRVVQGYLVEVGTEWFIHPNPAIAAMRALRQAVGNQ